MRTDKLTKKFQHGFSKRQFPNYDVNSFSTYMVYSRLEKVKLTSIRSQAKIVGTVATVAGAMIMTLVRGPIVELFWTTGNAGHESQSGGLNLSHAIKGSIMITIGCFSWAAFMILQVKTELHHK